MWIALWVEGSAALFLLAAFFLLERGFTTRVTTTVVRQVREQVVAPLEARVDAMATEIANLQNEVDARTREQTARHQDLVAALDPPTFASVSAALTEATRLNAIAGGEVTVQANADPAGIWLDFTYGAYFRGSNRTEADHLRIRVNLASAKDRIREILELDWADDEPVLLVAERMGDLLRQKGVRSTRNVPNWTVTMRNFQRSLDLALPADSQAWHVDGALYKLVGEDWAITTAGLEHRKLGLVLEADQFPRIPFPTRRRDGEEPDSKTLAARGAARY